LERHLDRQNQEMGNRYNHFDSCGLMATII
jgi:hypothetical protein